ncbi:MAG: hypothetical protein K0U72_00780 [Gammaproteobacteria bacterium]|nr:hypothetical protein [Gammaproteobacteria bacterium]
MLKIFDSFSENNKLAPAVLAAALSACATETVLLNSERIENRFGSYGIDVLASEASLRRSSLYSLDDGVKTCRTYALVRFVDNPDSSFGAEHAEVLAGNSLGEVFKQNGWHIQKQTVHIGSLPLPADTSVSTLMHLQQETTLALHVYQLLLARGEQVFEYAMIAEVHHPEYLAEEGLLEIYSYDRAGLLSEDALHELATLLTTTYIE